MTSTTRRFLFGVITTALLASAATPVAAVDFVRGDANDDGQVTIADAHYLSRFLFLTGGDGVLCGDAADVDDSGMMDLTDVVQLAQHVAGIGDPPSSPFPVPGPDGGYEPDIDDRWPCTTYGRGEPLADPDAALRILDAVAAGGDDAHVTLVLGMSNSERVAGYYAEIDSGGV